MNALQVANDLLSILVFFSAFIAVLTQIQIHNFLPQIVSVRNSDLHKWHRWAGWIAIGAFVINRTIYLRAGTALSAPFDPRLYVHGLLIAVCAIAVLRKVWVTQHTVEWSKKRIDTWWVSALILGASYFVLFWALTTFHWLFPTLNWDAKEQLIYKLAITGHVGLPTSLIWLGRSALPAIIDQTGPPQSQRVPRQVEPKRFHSKEPV